MVYFIKKFPSNLMSLTIMFSVIVIIGASLFFYQINYSEALAPAGFPAHSHAGWSLCKRSGPQCTTTYATHAQGELNWLHDNLPGFTISGGKLTVDGNFGLATENAVKNFQNWVKNNWGDAGMLVDGKIGNQTWTHMEFQVLNAYSGPGRHTAGVGLRFPIYDECRLVVNNAGLDIVAPLKSPEEWNAFKASAITTSSVGNCAVSGGSGSGGSGGSCTSQWGSCTASSQCCSGLFCSFDEVGLGLCR